MTFVVRTSGDPDAILPAVRRTIAEIVPDHAIADAGTVGQHLDAAMRQFRYFAFLMTVLACTAGALAVIGIYGTVAYGGPACARDRYSQGARRHPLADRRARRTGGREDDGGGPRVRHCGVV